MSLYHVKCKSYRTVDRPVLYEVSGRIYDLRCAKDRKEYFIAVLRQHDLRDGTRILPDYIAAHYLAFDYLSHHRFLGHKLMEALQCPTSADSVILIMNITAILGCNRLIFRFVFQCKERHFDLWKPLLSSWIAVLPQILSRSEVDAFKWFLYAISCAMPYWTKTQLLFARDCGLFAKETIQCALELPQSDKRKWDIFDILAVGRCLASKFKIKEPFIGHRNFRQYPIIDDIRKMREFETLCGWIPCYRAKLTVITDKGEVTKRKKSKKLYICKGCRLIKYCCRNHQKKHWKFIHSQQCKRQF